MRALLTEKWSLLTAKFDALNNRERIMVLGASALVVYSIINLLLIDPLEISKQRFLSEISTDQSAMLDMQQQVNVLKNKPPIDPNAQNKQRIATLESELDSINTAKEQLDITLISPDKMPELLRDLLAKNGKLKLVALNTLPTEHLLAQSQTPANMSASQTAPEQDLELENTVFKHGVEITIEGRYLDLLEYVTMIEKMDWHILWNKAELTTKNYPNNQLKLTLYTLSLDKAWLSI